MTTMAKATPPSFPAYLKCLLQRIFRNGSASKLESTAAPLVLLAAF